MSQQNEKDLKKWEKELEESLRNKPELLKSYIYELRTESLLRSLDDLSPEDFECDND